ncbi:MAG: HTH domain-containing protein [Nanoarchaeota archaeon]|nr:HTH domain-containing protein [Nanoarchaeota archaeon]
MEGLNDKEKKILKFLYRYKVSFPTNYIAKRVGISWATAENYLEILENEGYVISEERLGKTMYGLNLKKYKELKQRYGV